MLSLDREEAITLAREILDAAKTDLEAQIDAVYE